MLPIEFEQTVGYWVGMTTHALRRALSEELARVGITLRQWEVLTWMRHDPCMSQVDLAERLGIEPPTLAGVLSRMERDGWLQRSACTEDRRRKKLHLTPRASSVYVRMIESCQRVRTAATDGLSRQEIDDLCRICGTILENLSGWTTDSAEPV